MAFNREDLITWNELAPSFQTIIKALQTEITSLTTQFDTIRIIEKMMHFWYLYQKHKYSDHPHDNSNIRSLLRQPNTQYKVGDIVYDMELPPGAVLECVSGGFTAPDTYMMTYDSYISDEMMEQYNTVAKINTEIAKFHNVLEEHKVIEKAHPYASDFLVRQKNTAYAVGAEVFDDRQKDITKRIVVQTAGTTAAATTPTISDPVLASDLLGADEELENLNNQLEQHINSTNPHSTLSFLTRQPSTAYAVGDKVYIPGQNARYYLECKTAGTTVSSQLSIMIA